MTNNVVLNGKINWNPEQHKGDKYTITAFPLNFYSGKDKNGKGKYGTIQCKTFDEAMGEKVMTLGKDAKVIVVGKLMGNEYQNKEGKTVKTLELIVDYVG